MDGLMTLTEVAEYLRVSERTVKEWAVAGEIPGGKLGAAWRFKKADVKTWLDRQLTPHKHSKPLSVDYSLKVLLDPNKIHITEFDTKEELLNFFIDEAASLPDMPQRAEIADAVFKREELMSTGVGLGIAVPHVRLNAVSAMNIIVAVNRKDVLNYDSIDGRAVRVAMFFVVGRDQHSDYIKALSVILEPLKNKLIFQQILDADDSAEIYDIITRLENKK